MGRKLIIKGADFSQNAVSHSPNYEEVVGGTSENLWSNALTEVKPDYTAYGFICPYDGYVTGIRIKIGSANTQVTPTVLIYEAGATTYRNFLRKSTLKSEVETGIHEYELSEPLLVSQGQVVAINHLVFFYKGWDGDWQTTSCYGQLQNPPYRIYTFNFIMQKLLP